MNIREESITIVASQAHEDWKKEHFAQRGAGTPRPKPVDPAKDQAWIDAHNGATTCNIADTGFAGLPTEWQAENLAGATIAVDAVLATDVHDDAFIERTSDALHAAWIDRNRSWAPPEQLLPYAELPEGEKNKDRVFVVNALETVKRVRMNEWMKERERLMAEADDARWRSKSPAVEAEERRRAEEFRKDNGAF